MSKKLLIPILILVIIISFSAGGVFAEEISILQTVKLKLMSDIRGQGTTMVNGIEQEVRTVVETKLNQKGTVELDRATDEIQTYLDAQVAAVGNSQGVQDQIVDLEVITDIMVQEQKDAIDAAINSILQ